MKPKFARLLLGWTSVTLSLAAPSAYGDTETFNTAGTFNWVCPGGVTSIQVECWGGGGAGGGASRTGTANAGGGGGGGGAYAKRTTVPVTPGTTYTVTIPAAATCPTGFTNDSRVNGSSVTFTGDGGTTVTAAGGAGGQSKVATTAVLTGTLGAGGTTGTSVGDFVFAGGSGSTNTSTNGGAGGAGASDLSAGANASGSTAGATTTGSNAAHNGGAGGVGRTGDSVGAAGTAPGGGGGGAKVATASTARVGGAGGLGQIAFTYTIPSNLKTNNADDLNLASSWTAFVPNTGNIAEWNNLVTAPNTTSLGANLTFGGIKISDPAGPVTINGGGSTLTLGNAATDLDLNASTQNLTLNCNLAMGAANVWNVASARTLTLNGIVSGSAAVTKQGAGTAILTGLNTYTGATTVSAGTLVAGGGSASTGLVTVGNAAGNSVLNVPSGGTMTGGTSITAGTLSGAVGAVNLTGGKLTTTTDSDSSAFGAVDGGYGAFTISSGSTFTQPRFMFGGTGPATTGAAVGVGLITGGTVNSNNWFILSRIAASTGILTITGGTINHAGAANDIAVGLGSTTAASNTGRAELNVAGGLIDNTGRRVTFSGGTTGIFHWAGTGIVNLNAGTLLTNSFNYDASSPNANSYVNFSGGTLKAATSSATLLPSFSPSGINRVFVNGAFGSFAGGATIDTNGFNNTISANLLAPSGNGVTSLSIDAQGSGYIGAPAVKILDDGQPSTATAYAVVDTNSSSPDFGKVTSVVITNPGVIVGTATVSLVGGGGSGAAVSVAATGTNTSGGLTKSGAGALTLSGANTYTGPTLVSNGTLKSSTSGTSTTDITVAGGAAGGAFVAATDGQWINAGDLALSNSSTLVIDYGSATPSTSVAPISVENLGVGTNLGVKIEASSFAGLTVGQAYPLATWTTSGPSDGSAFTITTAHLGGNLSVSSNTLFLNVTSNAAGLPISWNTGDGNWNTASTNWLDGTSVATTYVDPQDAVIFGDAAGATGNPTVTLNSAFTPTGVTMNSTLHDYTITGSSGIGGSAGVTLDAANTKTLTLATANIYTGGTTINGGTLRLSGSGTLGPVGSTVSVSSGALLDLNGTNQAIRFIAGSSGVGTVANNSGSGTSTLTLSGTPTINGSLVTIADNTDSSNGKVAVVITGNTQPMSNANTYSGGTTVNGGGFLYLTSSSPLGAGNGPINLVAPGTGATGNTGSGLVVDNVTYANDITGAGYVHNNSNSGSTVVTTTLTGNLNTSGPFIFRAGTGIVYNFAGNGTISVLSGVIGSTTSQVNGAVASGSIIKSGTGTLTLSGANVYTGSTTVSAGILNLTGNRTATAGAITVGNLNGSTGTLNVSNGTFNTGTFAVGAGDGTALGVVNQTGGTLTLTSTQMIIGNGGSGGTLAGNGGNGTYNLSGGTLTATSVASRGVMLGVNDGGTSTFNLSGTGNLLLTGASSQLMVGRSDSPVVNTTNVFNQTGGSASVSILSIGGAAAGATGLNSTFSVTGGTFSAASFPSLGVGASGVVSMNIGGTADVTLPAFPTTHGAGTTTTISFDGGTLRPLAASAAYMGGLTAANIKAGGAKFDTSNGNITITQSLLADGVSTGGGLAKDGANTLILGGANTYTGNTTVNAGTLALADDAQLKFVLGATSGSNNSISGSGTVTLDGDFVIDTTAADSLGSGTWTLENASALTGAYGSTFTVVGFTDAGSDKWTKTGGGKTYTFDETTGVLTLVSSDPYASWATAKGLTGAVGFEAGKSDDPDGDGRNNLYEFAFDGNPLSGASDGKIVGKVATVSSSQVMTLTLPVRNTATFSASAGDLLSALIDGIYYRVEGANDLATFANTITEVTGGDASTIQAGLPSLSSGWSYRTFSAPGPVSTVPSTFLRARISETP